MASFSSRSHFTVEPNRLTQAIAQQRGAPLDLSVSNPTQVGLSPRGEELARLLADPGSAQYEPEPFGLRSARDVIAARYQVDPAYVMLTASTSEAYGYLFKLLCDPGDNVLVPTPSYPLFDVLAQLEQVELRRYRLAYDGDWHIAELTTDPRSKAILCVHPNNPTGSYLKRDELARLASLGLPIVSDEVFFDYPLTGADNTSAHGTDTLTFTLGGLSKACALPQLKLAWTIIDGPGKEAARARLEHIADAYLSPNTPVQRALPELLALGEAARAEIAARTRQNLAFLQGAVAGSAASLLAVEGGWYAILRLPSTLDDEAWALRFLEHGVIVQPGHYYELTGSHVVLSLITPTQDFSAGVERIVTHL